jgi:hypothetical protein
MEWKECPFCDYRALTTDSITGHISSLTDEAHNGKNGWDYVDEIED